MLGGALTPVNCLIKCCCSAHAAGAIFLLPFGVYFSVTFEKIFAVVPAA